MLKLPAQLRDTAFYALAFVDETECSSQLNTGALRVFVSARKRLTASRTAEMRLMTGQVGTVRDARASSPPIVIISCAGSARNGVSVSEMPTNESSRPTLDKDAEGILHGSSNTNALALASLQANITLRPRTSTRIALPLASPARAVRPLAHSPLSASNRAWHFCWLLLQSRLCLVAAYADATINRKLRAALSTN